VIEVVVILTPDQLTSIYERHPNEFSFTRKLIEWDLTGRQQKRYKAKRLQLDQDLVKVFPSDEIVPAFVISAK